MTKNEYVYVAPGRVNLIGEHTDYTGGFVLPMAIPFRTQVTVAPSGDDRLHLCSDDFATVVNLPASSELLPAGDWTDYPAGVIKELRALGIAIPGCSLHYSSNVPIGAGLSSSAAIEVATAMALLWAAGETMPSEQIALLCQRAENNFVGSPCGIMDQFVITSAKARKALLLNTKSLNCEHISVDRGTLADYLFLVVNSSVKHSVAAGEYGTIRRQMELGQQVLRDVFGVLDLGQASMSQLHEAQAQMSAESFRRCRHVITENIRVLEARAALDRGDASRMGELMTGSHLSQRDDLGTSVEEVDFLVDTALNQPGCAGARLTGGGFGGCTVNLVRRDRVDAFKSSLEAAYLSRFKREAAFYTCLASDGAHRLTQDQEQRQVHD